MKMIYWLEILADGRVYSCNAVPEGITPTPLNGGVMVIADRQYNPNEVGYFNGKIFNIGQPPTADHKYNYETREWVTDADVAWRNVRAKRDELMAQSDWRILPDAPTSEEDKILWKDYRQALRDITEQPDPFKIVWPIAPK